MREGAKEIFVVTDKLGTPTYNLDFCAGPGAADRSDALRDVSSVVGRQHLSLRGGAEDPRGPRPDRRPADGGHVRLRVIRSASPPFGLARRRCSASRLRRSGSTACAPGTSHSQSTSVPPTPPTSGPRPEHARLVAQAGAHAGTKPCPASAANTGRPGADLPRRQLGAGIN